MLLNNTQTATQAYLVPIVPSAATTGRRQLRSVVSEALDRGERNIVMDCADWNSPDVVMMSTLIGCAQLCATQGAGFQLKNVDVSVHDTLRDLRLASRLGLE